MKFLSRSEELVLMMISKVEGDVYGVLLKEHLEKVTGKYWSIGSVYVPLDRLESKGFVKSYTGEASSKRGGRSKRLYEITDEGRQQLTEAQSLYEKMASYQPLV
ncbi:MAG: PadR family transcriptional regulator [Rhodothermaceae bacterium]